MRTLPTSDPEALPAAAEALRAGGTVVLPTETVYGLAALPSVPGATDALFALKGRPDDVPLAVLVANFDQAAPWVDVDRLPAAAAALAGTFWPGQLTLVLPRRPGLDLPLGGAPATIGVRCPDHEFVRTLAAEVGPLATTSANRHGDPTPHTAVAAAASLTGLVDLVVDGGRCDGIPSTVVDVTGPTVEVRRDGAIDRADIERVVRAAASPRHPT